MTPLTSEVVQALAQQAAEPPYDPSCVECRRAAGKDLAGTTWQCVGHVYRERNSLSAEVRRLQQDNTTLCLIVEGVNHDMTCDAAHPCLRCQRDAALAERDALKAEVTRLYDELGSVSEELGLPRSIGPAPGWLKQQMADLKEARQLLATRVEADRLSEANDEIAALKSALESAAVGLGQSRVDRIAELENEVKTLRVFANAALEHQREAESALDARLLDARLSGNALDDTIVERDEAHAALTEARRVLRAQDECMVCKAELFRDLTVPHCFDCVVDDDHAEEWDAICAAKAAVLAQEVQP